MLSLGSAPSSHLEQGDFVAAVAGGVAVQAVHHRGIVAAAASPGGSGRWFAVVREVALVPQQAIQSTPKDAGCPKGVPVDSRHQEPGPLYPGTACPPGCAAMLGQTCLVQILIVRLMPVSVRVDGWATAAALHRRGWGRW